MCSVKGRKASGAADEGEGKGDHASETGGLGDHQSGQKLAEGTKNDRGSLRPRDVVVLR